MNAVRIKGKTYEVDVRGFLIDPRQWDEVFAVYKAHELTMPVALDEKHWEVIRYLRNRFKKTQMVPTAYETCRANRLQLRDLERLFPEGYERGAVKIAGLRVR